MPPLCPQLLQIWMKIPELSEKKGVKTLFNIQFLCRKVDTLLTLLYL